MRFPSLIRFVGAYAVLSLCFGCAALAAAPMGGQTVVTFQNPAAIALTQWPLRVGVPFARGARSDVANLALSEGKTLRPSQARALSRWPDGSVRWAIVDAIANLPAHGAAKLSVTTVATGAVARASVALDEADRVIIDTGKLRFEIPKQRFALLENLKVGEAAGLSGSVTDSLKIDEKVLSPQPPLNVRIIDNGPVRALVELRGHYNGAFDYLIRVEAYAGHAAVRILHTFESHSSDADNRLADLTLGFPLPDEQQRGGSRFRLGRDGHPASEGNLPSTGLSAVQLDNHRLEVSGKSGDGHLDGTLHLGSAEKGLALIGRWFWQQYPQAFEVTGQQVRYHLWAGQGGSTLAGSGSAKTHELVVVFGSEAMPAAQQPAAVAGPLIGHVDAAQMRATRALRNVIDSSGAGAAFLQEFKSAVGRYRERRNSEAWDDRDEATCAPDSKLPSHPRTGLYGMWNWGDWNYPGYHDTTKGCDAWGNLEYDLTQVMALGFAASGDATMLEETIAAARHFMDVDRIHFSTKHPSWVGMNHPKNPRHFSFELGGVDLGHTWTEGLISYTMLTGDERGLEAARAIGEYLVARVPSLALKGNPRQWGWPQIALVAVYEATADKRYLDAAEAYAKGGMSVHPPAITKDWKIGILAEGLAYTQSVSADPKIGEWLGKYAAAVVAYGGPRDARLLPALAYLGRAGKMPEYSKLASGAVTKLEFGGWGKPLTIAGRLGFSLLSQ